MAKVNIGGQAVLEGVMMKGRSHYAVAVRKADGTIVTETKECKSIAERIKLFRLPLFRGMLVFVESLVLGVKALNFSAELYGEEETEEEPSKFEKWLMDKLGDKGEQIIMGLVMVLSFALSIGLFMVLPMLIGAGIKAFVDIPLFGQNMVEGCIRILLFLTYMKLVTKVKDIKRTFEYHGAEHKCINCLEQDLPLTVENVRSSSRLHKSCGTSFLFVVMIISILVYSVFTTEIVWQRIVIRIVMLPIIAGLSYEFIRWARIKPNNKLANLLSKPGFWLQREFTTCEPDDKQIEVAIASVEGVFKYEPMSE
ncbi:MAG: DUF1385 domain-containing protein [Cellulosilyticum sp.]|nr:DUF1385 domain-containing protein [Cellulosilyticum sp.]